MNKWLEVSATDRTSSVAVEAIADRMSAVRHYLKKSLRDSEDPENVHQLRVWGRRADAALSLFEPLLPTGRLRKLRRSLKRLRRGAGKVRDQDVLLTKWPAKRLKKQRARAMDKLEQLAKRFRARRLKRLEARVVSRVVSGEQEYGDFFRERFALVVGRFFESAPTPGGDDKELHQFRIRGKQLRYALELAGDSIAVEEREVCYDMLGKLQDSLGSANDSATLLNRLRRRLETESDPAKITDLRRRSAEAHAELLRARDLFWKDWQPDGPLRRLANIS